MSVCMYVCMYVCVYGWFKLIYTDLYWFILISSHSVNATGWYLNMVPQSHCLHRDPRTLQRRQHSPWGNSPPSLASRPSAPVASRNHHHRQLQPQCSCSRHKPQLKPVNDDEWGAPYGPLTIKSKTGILRRYYTVACCWEHLLIFVGVPSPPQKKSMANMKRSWTAKEGSTRVREDNPCRSNTRQH